MAVELKKLVMSNRELEMAIMRESGGCCTEDNKNRIYDINTDVILISIALAKKLLGIYGLEIGLDPRKRKLTRPRDFRAEKSAISTDDPWRKQKLKALEEDEEDYLRAASSFDPDAWDQAIRLEDRIARRALALSKIGLVVCNIDHLTPDAVSENEIRLGNESGRVPLEGTIMLSEAGKQFLGRAGKLRKKRGWSGDPLDEEVEIVK
jgi:hypothetical protein